MNLIVPLAGNSSRFPNMRPKWMLTHPNGNLMLGAALSGLKIDDLGKIYFTVLQEHDKQFDCVNAIKNQCLLLGLSDKIIITLLSSPTESQPETVAETIKLNNINGPFCVKDPDNYFELEIKDEDNGNFIGVSDLNINELINASNKSYVSINDENIVTNIVEKNVISNLFCCGLYSFSSAEDFVRVYEQIQHYDNLYISHIIYKMILDNVYFEARKCHNYSDWGTLEDWNKYKAKFSTLFIDLDGVLVESSSQFFNPFWGETKGIEENIELISKLYGNGKTQIIITTSRSQKYKDKTLLELKEKGVKYHHILFGLQNSKRIIINDYADTNPYKSCEAINIERNSNRLSSLLKGILT